MVYRGLSGGLRELSERECFNLLSTVDHGQLAITQKALPAIVPIRLWLIEDELIVSSLLGPAVLLSLDSVVALRAGPLGRGLADDWSVEVRGFLKGWSDSSAAIKQGDVPIERFRVTADHVRGWSAS